MLLGLKYEHIYFLRELRAPLLLHICFGHKFLLAQVVMLIIVMLSLLTTWNFMLR